MTNDAESESEPTAPGAHPLLPKDAEQATLRSRIRQLQSRLAASFVAQDHIAQLVVVSAIAAEPLLLVGAPGSGKSAIVRRFAQLLNVPGESFFEYILTPNTSPSELYGESAAYVGGPVTAEVGAAGQGSGSTLMTAQVVFLDEVFHANSAVLNALIYRLSRRGLPVTATSSRSEIGLNLVVAATTNLGDPIPNELLLDRFTLQANCDTVNQEHFSDVIRAGIRSELLTDVRSKLPTDVRSEIPNTDSESPIGSEACTIRDIVTANRCVQVRLASSTSVGEGGDLSAAEGYADFERLIQRLRRKDRVFISDRKLIKLYKLLSTVAWLDGEPEFSRSTLHLLSYIGNTADEMQILVDKVPLLIEQLA